MSSALPTVTAAEALPASTLESSQATYQSSLFADYAQLLKLRVTGMVVLTAWAGYYLGSLKAHIPSFSWDLLASLLGIGVVSGGAAALNQVMESHPDSLMRRTQRRPIAAGRMGKIHG